MHAVKCPKCHKLLHLDRAMQAVKLKCRNCGHVFVADTVDVPDVGTGAQNAPQRPAQRAASAPVARPAQAGDPNANRPHRPQNPGEPAPQNAQFAQGQFPPSGQSGQYSPGPQQYAPQQYPPQYPPQYGPPMGTAPYGQPDYGPARRQTSPVLVITLILLAIGIVGGGVFAVWYSTRTPAANVTPAVAQVPATPALLPLATPPPRHTPTPTPAPDGTVDNTPAAPAAPAVPTLPQGDDKILVQALRVIPGTFRGSGDVIGELQNNYGVPLRTASVSMTLTPKDGQPIAIKDAHIQYIPARARVPFSAPFEVDADVDESASANGVANGDKADAKTICWLVPEDQLHVGAAERKVVYVLDGRVRNDSGAPVKDVIVYGDFFLGNGVYKGSDSQPIDNTTRTIGVNKTANFRLKFDTEAAGFSRPSAVKSQCVRVVAQKP